MKRRIIIIAGTAGAAALLSIVLPTARVLVWNATASVPIGLYHIRGTASLHRGERVAIAPPPELRRLLAERGYLPSGVPLLKEVAALRGDIVCRRGLIITVNGATIGEARARQPGARAAGLARLPEDRTWSDLRHEPPRAGQLRRALFRTDRTQASHRPRKSGVDRRAGRGRPRLVCPADYHAIPQQA